MWASRVSQLGWTFGVYMCCCWARQFSLPLLDTFVVKPMLCDEIPSYWVDLIFEHSGSVCQLGNELHYALQLDRSLYGSVAWPFGTLLVSFVFARLLRSVVALKQVDTKH